MFESAQPFLHAQTGRFAEPDSGSPEASGATLRVMDWSELTARLNAARDVRHVLRRDANRGIKASADCFADAAARYFRTKEEGERDVNPVALEQSKGSPGIVTELQGLEEKEAQIPGKAEEGVAREDK